MRIQHIAGADNVEFSYYAEAEPRLEEIRREVEFGSMNEIEARDEIIKLVGPHRFNREWDSVQAANPCPPGRSPQIWALEKWEEQLPDGDLRRRLFGVAAAYNIEVLLGFEEPKSGPRNVL